MAHLQSLLNVRTQLQSLLKVRTLEGNEQKEPENTLEKHKDSFTSAGVLRASNSAISCGS
jgi:hypothetical protein